MLRQRHTDCVDRFVPVEAFIHQPRERAPHRDFVPGRDLIFDHHVEDGVRLPVWQPKARPPRQWSMPKTQFAVLFGERFTMAVAAALNIVQPPARNS